jgi:type IV fimbrial biogenesis protein FimT
MGRRGPPGARGFTLVESMFALLIAAVLLAIGVPAFNDVFLSAKVSSITNDLMASVQLARSEAIKRNIPITLCRSADGTTCAAATDWEGGWIILDAASATVLQHIEAQPADYRVMQQKPVTPTNLVFQPIGVGATNSCFKVYRASAVGNEWRLLTVSATGSAYVTAELPDCP